MLAMQLLLILPFNPLAEPYRQYKSIRRLILLFQMQLDKYSRCKADKDCGSLTECSLGDIQLELVKRVILHMCSSGHQKVSRESRITLFSCVSGLLFDSIVSPASPCMVPTAVGADVNFFKSRTCINIKKTPLSRTLHGENNLVTYEPFPELHEEPPSRLGQPKLGESSQSLLEILRNVNTSVPSNKGLASRFAKTRDENKQVELNIARRNSIHMVDLLRQITEVDPEKVSILAHMLLTRLMPVTPFPSDEEYKVMSMFQIYVISNFSLYPC